MAKQNQPSAMKTTKSKPVPSTPALTTPQKESSEAANVASPLQKAKNQSPARRNLTGTKRIFTDLFKLMVAKVIKYEGWDEANEHPDTHPQKYSTWEHTHPFRTYDKKGDRMTMCTPIGGHFHLVEFEESDDPDAPPIIKSISGPMVMGKEKIRGRMTSKPVPSNEYDEHTHDWEYIRSAHIEVGTTNIEASAVIAADAQKTAPVAGVAVQ